MITIGIMTGNSLDAADVVMTEFSGAGSIHDIAGVSVPYPAALRQDMLDLREEIIALGSDMDKAAKLPKFRPALKTYTELLAGAVEELLAKAACRGKTWRPSGCTDSRRVNIIRPLRPAAASRLRHRCLTRRGWRKRLGFLWFTISVPTIFSTAAKARLWRRCTICTSVTPFPGAECFRSVLSTGEILPIWRWSAAARPCAKSLRL